MIKIIIKNKQGIETHGATFKTQSEADAWISEQRSLASWGKPSGVYNESMLSEEEKIGAIEILPEGDQHFIERQFQIQDQFTIEQVDISDQIAAQKELQDRINGQNFGALFLATVVNINAKKYAAGTLTLQDLDTMDSDPALLKLERAAKRGDIKGLKYLVSSYSGPYYSPEEKSYLILMINKYIGV